MFYLDVFFLTWIFKILLDSSLTNESFLRLHNFFLTDEFLKSVEIIGFLYIWGITFPLRVFLFGGPLGPNFELF